MGRQAVLWGGMGWYYGPVGGIMGLLGCLNGNEAGRVRRGKNSNSCLPGIFGKG